VCSKLNFWIDDVSGNPYFVGVQYPQASVESLQTLLDIPITGINQNRLNRRVAVDRPPQLIPGLERNEDHEIPAPVRLSSLVKLSRGSMPTEITHVDHNPSIDLSIGVSGRDLGHVADDIHRAIDGHFGRLRTQKSARGGDVGTRWDAFDPDSGDGRLLEGAQIELSGEYARMMQTFRNRGIGLTLSVVIIYFMMVALDKSFLVPLCGLIAVPLILIGVWPALYLTGTLLNVQSLTGIIFSVGIKVANTVLMTDVAQELRKPKDSHRWRRSVRRPRCASDLSR
jgi:multidrug efflux pump subunit AcrB